MVLHLRSDASERRKALRKSRTAWDFISGAVSGCISRFAVGPFDVLKIRFQVQIEPITAGRPRALSKYTGIVQAVKTIVKEEGVTALWRGTVPGQLLTIPYTAAQFVTLQKSRAFLQTFSWAERRATLVSFIGGGIAGASATLCSYPFDLLRTTLAAQGEPKVYSSMTDAAISIYRSRGIVGLYRGLSVTLVEIIPYSAIQFASYEFFHNTFDTYKAVIGSKSERGPLDNFFCGFAAGVVSKLATHPLDVIKKRYQVAGLRRSLAYGERVDVENVRTILLSFRRLIQKEGIKGLWKGSLPNILKAGPAAAVTLVSYEFLIALLTAES